MPTPFEVLQVADLIKLAAETAKACSEMQASADMVRITDLSLRIQAAATELQEIGREMQRRETARPS